jgi:hypothetical protein
MTDGIRASSFGHLCKAHSLKFVGCPDPTGREGEEFVSMAITLMSGCCRSLPLFAAIRPIERDLFACFDLGEPS